MRLCKGFLGIYWAAIVATAAGAATLTVNTLVEEVEFPLGSGGAEGKLRRPGGAMFPFGAR